jgi:hypothetical protein
VFKANLVPVLFNTNNNNNNVTIVPYIAFKNVEQYCNIKNYWHILTPNQKRSQNTSFNLSTGSSVAKGLFPPKRKPACDTTGLDLVSG